MYLQTILEHYNKPQTLRQTLHTHFFKPYENTNSFVQGFFYPLEAIFTETLPNLMLALHHSAQGLISAFTMLGWFALGHKKEAHQEKNNVINAVLITTLALLTAVIGPLLETIRFFTRWGASLTLNMNTKEEAPRQVLA